MLDLSGSTGAISWWTDRASNLVFEATGRREQNKSHAGSEVAELNFDDDYGRAIT